MCRRFTSVHKFASTHQQKTPEGRGRPRNLFFTTTAYNSHSKRHMIAGPSLQHDRLCRKHYEDDIHYIAHINNANKVPNLQPRQRFLTCSAAQVKHQPCRSHVFHRQPQRLEHRRLCRIVSVCSFDDTAKLPHNSTPRQDNVATLLQVEVSKDL